MKLINKVSISKFRSFGEKTEFSCSDLNVFTGCNDCGKSNIVKALDLFFNNKVGHERFNPDSDFNKWFRDNNERGTRDIVIKIYFAPGNYKDIDGINNGFIAEKIFGIDGSIRSYFYLSENQDALEVNSTSYKRADSVIRDKIKFIYVPAIRDEEFRRALQKELLQITNSGNKLSETFSNLRGELDKTFAEFSKTIKTKVNISVNADIQFSTLLESMTFNTNEQIVIRKRGRGGKESQPVAMINRGDGIQMQFLSFLLWFLTTKDRKHRYIWGYEEPEIAFEYKKQFEMSNVFSDVFPKNAQIFATTHSPAFLFKETEHIKQYRVYKFNDEKKNRYVSRVTNLFEKNAKEQEHKGNEYQLRDDLLGYNYHKIFNILGNIVKDSSDYKGLEEKIRKLQEDIRIAQKESEASKKREEDLSQTLNQMFPDNIFICEDEKAVSIWTEWFKLFEIEYIKIISSKGCGNDTVEIVFENKIKENPKYKPKIYRELDRDGYTSEQITYLENIIPQKHKCFAKYKIKFLPVCEIENFIVLSEKIFTEEFIREDETSYDKIKDALCDTARENLRRIKNKYESIVKEEDKKLFEKTFNPQNMPQKMRDEAKNNIKSFFPGKDICKLTKIKVNTKFKNFTLNTMPDSLKEYLEDIRNFFN